jgi:hypothetical protein
MEWLTQIFGVAEGVKTLYLDILQTTVSVNASKPLQIQDFAFSKSALLTLPD